MAHWEETAESSYARLRADYDAAFARMKSAAGRLCRALEFSYGAAAEKEARRLMEEAILEYRQCRDRLARFLAGPSGALRSLAAQRRPSPEEVQKLAYQLWEQAGRPSGTAEEDWRRAEELLEQAS